MIDIWLVVLLTVMFSALSGFDAWRLGRKKGAKLWDDNVLQDWVALIPVSRVGDYAAELMEENGYSEFFPLMIVQTDKYEYDETDQEDIEEI